MATGVKLGQTIQWYQAFAHGPLGPVMVRNLNADIPDQFIFPDQVGTPFAYTHDDTQGAVSYTPYAPFGEALFDQPMSSPYGESETVAVTKQTINLTSGFQLPIQPAVPATTGQLGVLKETLSATPTLGLGGHPYDPLTGMVTMHHRHYSPRLGHFLNPDFRAPDLYDPSTFTEPYAYAAGNPVMFWDPDGLAVEYIGNGRVKIEARDIYGVLQTLYMPQEHWVKLVTGQAVGYGSYTGEYFKLKAGVPDLTTDQGKALYKLRANAVLENFFGPGVEITKSAGENV